MRIWVLHNCEIEHVQYEAGQKLDVSDVLGAYLLRASPESFSTTDPHAAPEPAPEAKAVDVPPYDKMVKAPERKSK